MPQVTGKTVYILGAGTSFHTGAPLLRDFLVTARFLLESKPDLVYKDSFHRVFEWINQLRGAAYYIDLDLDNIEHLFSIAEMKKQLGESDGDEIYSDLRYVILETLDTCQVEWRGDYYQPDPTYLNFIEKLSELNESREKINLNTQFDQDTVITFNYDVMLDYAFYSRSIETDYGLEEIQSSPNSFKVLKLHGSLNWGRCKECDGEIQIVTPTPTTGEGITSSHPLMQDGTKKPFQMVTRVMKETPCNKCKKKNVLEPEIIPPTWSKYVTKTPLPPVWRTAVREIQTAFQIVVIGYSMPLTDTFFQYLLTLGLSTNPNLHRVVVANVDNSETLMNRYRSVFSRSMNDRGRLKFPKNKEKVRKFEGDSPFHPKDKIDKASKIGATFSSFIKEHMDKFGSEV